MPVSVSCPQCGALFTVSDEFLGKRVRCKSCGGAIPVGAPPAPEPLARTRRRPVRERNRGGTGVGKLLLVLLLVAGPVVVLVAAVGVGAWALLRTSKSGLVAAGGDDSRGWPAPPALRGNFGPNDIVILHISGVDATTDDPIGKWLSRLVDPGNESAMALTRSGDRMTAQLAPVRDPVAFSKRVEFGRVILVVGRTVTIIAHKNVAPPPKK